MVASPSSSGSSAPRATTSRPVAKSIVGTKARVKGTAGSVDRRARRVRFPGVAGAVIPDALDAAERRAVLVRASSPTRSA